MEALVDASTVLARVDAAARLRLSADDAVLEVGDDWNAFCRTRVASLRPARPGTPFWDSVAGAAAMATWEALLGRARDRYVVVVDAWGAAHDRLTKYELQLVAQPRREVVLTLRPLFHRPTPPLRFFADDAARSSESLPVCGFCQSVLGFSWTDAATALRQLRVDPAAPQPRVKPSLCDGCERQLYALAGTSTRRG